VADSPGKRTLVWWADLTQGRHRVGFGSGNNVFNEACAHVPNGRNRGLTVESFEFVRLPARPAKVSEVYRVRIRQRSAAVAPAMPLAMSADALDAWGRPLAAKVAWKASGGAAVTPEGLFSARQAGKYTVTASAGGKADTVTVAVRGDAFIEDFDDEWADGWAAAGEDAWSDKDKANWTVWRKGTGWMGTLLQTTSDWGRKPDRAGHLFVYEASAPWSDVHVTADRLPGRLDTTQGVVVRYQDPKNHYRFEKRTGKGADGKPAALLRLVKGADGKETVLKAVEMDVPPLTIADPAGHRTFQHWGEGNLAQLNRQVKRRPIEFDRFEVRAPGREITAHLNGREVLKAEDTPFRSGAIGLYCPGRATFDNVETRPLK